MKNNKEITTEKVASYLERECAITKPEQLFAVKKETPKEYFNIVNRVFKHFTAHYIDHTNQLVCLDPDDPVFQYYVFGYPGYFPLNSLEDLVWDMNQANHLRDQNLESYKRRIGILKEKEQESKQQGTDIER